MRKGEELKAPRHASAAATRNSNLLSRDGSLPYITVTYLIPNRRYSRLKIALEEVRIFSLIGRILLGI
jgi:hypothetical protein